MQIKRSAAAVLTLAGAVALATAGGCAGQKSAAITIDNQSAAALQVEVTMPAKGVFGRKPCLEGYVMRVGPGATWESTPDTRKWSMDPNPRQEFRLVAVENEATPVLIYEAAWFDTGKKHCHLVLRGRPGAISCQAVKEGGAPEGAEVQLKPRQRE